MCEVLDRYSRKQVERAMCRALERLDPDALPADDSATDLRHEDGELVTFGELIEAYHIAIGLCDDESEPVEQADIPEHLYVTVPERKAAYRERRMAAEEDREMSASATAVFAKMAEWRKLSRPKAVENDGTDPDKPVPDYAGGVSAVEVVAAEAVRVAELTNDQMAERLRAAGFTVKVDKAKATKSPPQAEKPALVLVTTEIEGQVVASAGAES